jgi:hypothetical protein
MRRSRKPVWAFRSIGGSNPPLSAHSRLLKRSGPAHAIQRHQVSWPLSTSQIERLGVRLVQASAPAEVDLELLHQLLAAYSELLAGAVDRVRSSIDVAPTSRIKNTGTLLEKLHRYGGSWLRSIQDLAGMRIVRSFDRRDQDAQVWRAADALVDARRARHHGPSGSRTVRLVSQSA